ncbi:MAG: isoprenylcysteine carboxylmethyltransferase family protein [Anaerolineae bacterium]|nr:isoprenylcysteine carboxylmethyltransferase family protein [Anaerolineae bacterium]
MARQIQAFMLPITVTGFIPLLLISTTNTLNTGWGLPPPIHLLPILLGLALIAGGLWLMIMTIRMFITIGKGTLAPWDPTRRLVVVGIYRYVRNPMISGVCAVVLGEAILFGSVPVLIWALIVIAVNLVYIPLSEEPGLRQRFGADYDEYMHNVPRWIPRLSPWIPPNS